MEVGNGDFEEAEALKERAILEATAAIARDTRAMDLAAAKTAYEALLREPMHDSINNDKRPQSAR